MKSMREQVRVLLIAMAIVSLVVEPAMCGIGRGGGGFGGGRGGGGFGGGSRIGGGGGVRPSAPAVSRPAARPSTPSIDSRPAGGGGARPSIGSSPSFSRPPGSRPATGIGGSGLQPGSRPAIGSGARPSLQPGIGRDNIAGARPGAGTRPATGIGSGAGIGSGDRVGRPAGAGSAATLQADRAAQIRSAAIAGGAATLPGLSGGAGSRLPNQGAALSDRMANRPQTLEDRRTNLNDRLSGANREDWQQHREDMQGNRQDWRDQNREDWQNFADDHRYDHGDWYHDCWHDGDWDFGDGWDYMWDNYPVMSAFGVTRWGINRLAYGFGYWGYSNPYAGGGGGGGGYSYSEPLVSYSEPAPEQPATDTGAAEPAADPGMTAFDEARTAFYGGDYAGALSQLDITLKTMPRDTVVHEFRGLVLFALEKYPEAAAADYAVLSAGPGWDWTTMSGLYASVDTYTEQLRKLESFAKANPKSGDAHFLLGYHYMTAGHKDASVEQFKAAQQLVPDDRLLQQLAGVTQPPAKSTASPAAASDVPADKVLTLEAVTGKWTASRDGSTFEMELKESAEFTWTFSAGPGTQTVSGVFAVDKNILAMEVSDGTAMIAEVKMRGANGFSFKLVGGDANDPGLVFSRAK